MKREILIEDIKFWVDQDIIYCKFYNGFDQTFLNTDLEKVFEAAITKLSDGKYRSIILNLRDIDNQLSLKVFKFLSSNALIKSLRSEEHTSELQSRPHLVCRLLLEKKKDNQ